MKKPLQIIDIRFEELLKSIIITILFKTLGLTEDDIEFPYDNFHKLTP